MRQTLTLLGLAIALAGLVFTLQGIGLLLGSFMSNNPQWVINGIIIIGIGAALMVFANWPRKPAPPKN